MTIRFSRETVLVAVLVFIVVASALDFYMDLTHGASTSHVIKEALIAILATVLVAWILKEQRGQAIEIERLRQELERTDRDLSAMSEDMQGARRQLSEVITRQFEDWKLTASEKEVGWLLLKGLSLREISAIRNTGEKTVRQQASDIYRKAGLSGRHAFSAWFIEDLF